MEDNNNMIRRFFYQQAKEQKRKAEAIAWQERHKNYKEREK